MAKLRWRIANRLDTLPGFCWANLVDWVLNSRGERRRLGYRPFEHLRIDQMCRDDAARTGLCYCGKIKRQVAGG